MQVHKLYTDIKQGNPHARLIQIKTDSLTVEIPKVDPILTIPEMWTSSIKMAVKVWRYCTRYKKEKVPAIRVDEFVPPVHDLEIEQRVTKWHKVTAEELYNSGMSCCITGKPGSGKTFNMIMPYVELCIKNKDYIRVAN